MSAVIKTIAKELQQQVDGAKQEPGPEEKTAIDSIKAQLKSFETAQLQWKQMTQEEQNDVAPFVSRMHKTDKNKLIISINSCTMFTSELTLLIYKRCLFLGECLSLFGHELRDQKQPGKEKFMAEQTQQRMHESTPA